MQQIHVLYKEKQNIHLTVTLSRQTETQSILIEHQLSCSSFGPLIMSEQPDSKDWRVDAEEVTLRRDLRQTHLIFSIDPKGCEDVDDALSVR